MASRSSTSSESGPVPRWTPPAFTSSPSWRWATSDLGIRADAFWGPSDAVPHATAISENPRSNAIFCNLNLGVVSASPYLTFTKVKQLLVYVRHVFGGAAGPQAGTAVLAPTTFSSVGGGGGSGLLAVGGEHEDGGDGFVEALLEDPALYSCSPALPPFRAMISKRAMEEQSGAIRAGCTLLLRDVSIFCAGPGLTTTGRGARALRGVMTARPANSHIVLGDGSSGGGSGGVAASSAFRRYVLVAPATVVCAWPPEGPLAGICNPPLVSSMATDAAVTRQVSTRALPVDASTNNSDTRPGDSDMMLRHQLEALPLESRKGLYNHCVFEHSP